MLGVEHRLHKRLYERLLYRSTNVRLNKQT